MIQHHSLTKNDLDKVSDWAYTWQMSFNPDPSKQTQEVIFSGKCQKRIILPYILIIYQSYKTQLQYSHKREA